MLVAQVFGRGGCKNRFSIVRMLLFVPLKEHVGTLVTVELQEVMLQDVEYPLTFTGRVTSILESKYRFVPIDNEIFTSVLAPVWSSEIGSMSMFVISKVFLIEDERILTPPVRLVVLAIR